MYSIESRRSSTISNRKVSFKIIEKRLNHLREELHTLTNQEHHQNDNHHVQYKKRLDQLLRSYEKQV
jgi:hypothetical protein